jgi:hypothetical protein
MVLIEAISKILGLHFDYPCAMHFVRRGGKRK